MQLNNLIDDERQINHKLKEENEKLKAKVIRLSEGHGRLEGSIHEDF